MAPDGEARKRRRGVTVHRAGDAVALQDTDFMTGPTMSDDAGRGFGTALSAGLGAGGGADVVVRQSGDEGGFSLVRLWFKSNYPLVRHTHDADCLYYVLSGSAILGSQTLRTGDAFFVPAGAPYRYTAGPDGVEVLEIRHGVEQFDMAIPDQSPARWTAMVETVAANRNAWGEMRTSPTMVANRTDTAAEPPSEDDRDPGSS